MTRIFFYKSLFELLLFLYGTVSFSQTATRQYLDSVFKTMDTNFKQKRGVLYIINGVPFDSLQLDTELAKYDLKHLVKIFFLPCEKIGTSHCYNDAALILFAYNQKNKTKRKAWNAAKQLYSDSSDIPVLLIDNSIIDLTISEQKFKSLRLRDIMYIDTTQKDNRPQIRIWKAK